MSGVRTVKTEPIEDEMSLVDNKKQTLMKNSRRIKVCLLFQQSEVGPIIGKGGATIKSIKSQSGCHLNFYDLSHRNRTLVILGEKHQAHLAVELVAKALKDDEVKSNGGTSNGVTEKGGRVSIFWILPRDSAISLIGKEGCNAKRTKEETNVNISVLFGDDHASAELLVRLTGLPSELSQAFSLSINEFIKDYGKQPRFLNRPVGHFGDAHRSRSTQYNRGTLRYTPPNQNGTDQFKIESTQTIQLTRDLAGAVIGKGGGNINRIRSISGANIKINTPEESEELATVVVVGRPSAVAVAFELIEECIQIYLSHGNRSKTPVGAISTNINSQSSSKYNGRTRRLNKGKLHQQDLQKETNGLTLASDSKENFV